MTFILREKIQGPIAWKGMDLAKDDSWIYYLSKNTIASLESALYYVKQKGLQIPDFNKYFDMMMEPGDMQFVNNYTVSHSRTVYEDYEEPERKRHLLRLWLTMPNGREIAPDFAMFIDEKTGRGGIPVRVKTAGGIAENIR